MTPQADPIPIKTRLLFLALLVIMFFLYRYPHSMQKGPYSFHMWRQTDCLSWTKNYLEEGFHFFKPTVHWSLVNTNDKTVGEFPVIFYLVSLLWSVFGQHEIIFRIVNLLIVFLGLYYVFRFTYDVTSDSFWSLFTPVLLFTSPVLVYYSNNFIVNAPSFGLALIALYQYWKYIQKGKVKHLYISSLIFLVAGLLKVPAFISFVAIAFIQFLSQFQYFRNTLKIKRIGNSIHFLPVIGVFVVFLVWVLWARQYNNENITGLFVLGIRPIWKVDDIYHALYFGTQLHTLLSPSFFNPTAMAIILSLFVWLLIKYNRTDRFLTIFTLITSIGALFYMAVFFQGFTVHDYYLTNLLIMIPLIVITFLHYLKSNGISIFYSKAFRGLAIAGLILLIYNTMVLQRAKYDMGDTFVKHTVLLDDHQKSFLRSLHNEYRERYEALSTITPYLRELGIERKDHVISVPDESPNITLYLMDQKGCTEYGLFNPDGSDRIGDYFETGTRYLIVNDPGYLNKEFLRPYIDNKIGQYKNVNIFKLTLP